MTREEARELLCVNGFSFKEVEYENEAAYFRHAVSFSDTLNAKPCKVATLVIPSRNGHKNLELQFCETDCGYQFAELWFGGYSYELFDTLEEQLQAELLAAISEVTQGKTVIILVNNLKKGKRLGDSAFDYHDDAQDFRRAMERIEKKKGLFDTLLRTKTQYEIFDWSTYRCIIK